MTSFKILIAGANSKIAEPLVRLLKSENFNDLVLLARKKEKIPYNDDFVKYSVNSINISELKNICYNEKPDVIVNTIGYNDIEKAEINRKLASDANIIITENFVNISRVLDCTLIQLSCENIFNGVNSPYTEESLPNPLNYIGKTKHAAENSCLARHHKSVIVRCSPIYGNPNSDYPDFVTLAINKLLAKKECFYSDKYFTSPSFSDDIARVIIKIIEKKRYGIYNAAGPEVISHKEILFKIAKVFNLDYNLFLHKQHNQLFNFPMIQNAGLINFKSETDLGIKFTSFENGLLAMKAKMQVAKSRLLK